MSIFSRNARFMGAACAAVLGLLTLGCEEDLRKYENSSAKSANTENPSASSPSSEPAAAPESAPAPATPTGSGNVVITIPGTTNTMTMVLNDDPNCELVLKYQGENIDNEGQVHYTKRILVADPFGSANPVCLQYNDTSLGEVTVWKEPSSTGRRIDVLPANRGINKIVVWFN